METLKTVMTNNIRKFGMIIALVGIALLFQILTSGSLLTPLNVTNIIMQNSYIIVLAIGMMLIIITGEIDLSVGSVAAFIGAIAGVLIVTMDMPVIVGVIICLIIGALIGVWQGFWVAYMGIPAFIVTLAGMLLFRGLTLVVLGGRTIAPFPNEFRQMSTSFLPDISGGDLHLLTLLIGGVASLLYVLWELQQRRAAKYYNFRTSSYAMFVTKIGIIILAINAFTFLIAQYRGIPVVLLILVVLVLGYTFVMTKTVLGRHIYAVGGNTNAAQLSGVKTKKMKFLAFVNMGFLSALAGLIFASRLNAATPQAGQLFELDAIAAAVIGGASFTGGIGTIFGAVIGALVMGVLNNGMSLMGIGTDWQQAIKGLVLLGAVAFDVISKNRGK
ncbi:multiple monosaccharide ABC transporter permease [Evansella cellulosilytica]|uniref:Xylose transport system permease protein XylH n=1 Tax=Evansella cellulosilytica (strain ATCC 21833 / DSM 2522 / FERM P-1141 / JCM 9156 / N-4) TaxID=649639 RepID=E6TRV2_EVAC2|nr:multiple monosaccharide ABC transporter permease [Evansella cellulosilytica]ADU29475.1 inner-membrane translocator [Evansella cellulosilytica DSM 2522]